MAENTFSRRIEIRESSSKERLKHFLESDDPARKLSKPIYSFEEREKSKLMLEQCLKSKK